MSASGYGAWPAARSRRRRLLWPLLLGAHLLLWLLPDRVPSVRNGPADRWLRLVAAKAPVPKPAPPMAAPVLTPPPAPAMVPPPSLEIASEPVPVSPAPPGARASTGAVASAPADAAQGSGPAPLIVRIPAAGKPGQFTPFQNPATNDPRSRSIRLTFEEKMAIAAGTAECFLEEREPDGSIWRGPGKLKHRASASALTGAAASAGGMVTACVR